VRSRWNLPIYLAYAVAGLVVFAFVFGHAGGAFFFRPSYQIAADFQTAGDVVPGDDVTVAGVTVGRVASVQVIKGGAQVRLQLQEQYAPLYQDARAMIKIKNILDESYVELYRGSAASGPMPQGGVIPFDRTLTPVELAQVLDVLNADTGTQLASLINSLGESVAGRGPNLNASATSLKTTAQSLDGIAHALASQQVNLGSLISSLSKVLATLATWHDQLKGLVANWDAVMRALAQHEQQLQDLVVNENQVMAILDQALSRNSAALQTAIAESPALINSADRYTAGGGIIFGKVSQQVKPIDELFYELASVFSATDSEGNHYWRVYPVVGGLPSLGQPPSSQKGTP
jgi:phospholipid/cholesterol/gamma-HCH transport system substrate-binding protein